MNRYLKINLTDDARVSSVICLIIACIFFTSFSEGAKEMTGISSEVVSNICKMIIFVGLAFCVPVFIRRLRNRTVMYVIGCFLVAAFQMYLFPQNNTYFRNTFITHLTTVVPVVACVMVIENYTYLVKKIIKTSFLLSAILVVSMIVFGNNFFETSYGMGFANSLILPTDILIMNGYFFYGSTKEKRVSFVFSITNIIAIVMYGSRGAAVAILIFWAYVELTKNITQRKKIIRLLFLFMAVVLFVVNIEAVGGILNEIAQSLGFSSRTLNLLTNKINYDSGRWEIWRNILNDFTAHPLKIRGINSDYMLTGQYAHNFIFELLHESGVIFGIVASGIVLSVILRTLCTMKRDAKSIFNITMIFSFFPLCLWSGSIWTNYGFWVVFFNMMGKEIKHRG